MFGDFDVDGAIEEAGGFDKAFKTIKPVKKSGGGIAKGARTAKKVAEAIQRRAKEKKKSESPPSARRDMAKKDVFTGEKYQTNTPKNRYKQMTPEYRAFLNKQAKKEARKDKLIAGGGGLGVGTGFLGAMYAGGERERERLKKEEERIKKFREKKSKPKNKTPVKKARGGMVTRWESKWG